LKGGMTAMELRDRKVLLTGAAGGLGTAITLAFAKAGARVLALDVPGDKGDALLAECARQNIPKNSVRFVSGDLADLAATGALVRALCEEEDGVDTLINNAAIYPSHSIEDYTIAQLEAVQRINVQASIVATQAVIPGMKQRAFGRIINVASITFSGGWANILPYVTSRVAVIAMTRALARELGPSGVTVNCISPGAFPTDAEKIHPDLEGYTRFILDHQAIKRRGRPEEIANAMMFFASERSGFITGQTLNVDGGWIMN
jgi:3-oxoacyl-[acyl-carrier protein] reductase